VNTSADLFRLKNEMQQLQKPTPVSGFGTQYNELISGFIGILEGACGSVVG
jgi:hypothetical protein